VPTTDGSMAVWSFLKVDAPADASAEVHFNYWRIAGDPTFKPTDNFPRRDFVEIGVLLTNAARVDSVRIYLPGQQWAIEDCGARFISPDIAQAIFNVQLTATVPGAPGPLRVELSRPNGTPFCRVYRFPLLHDEIDNTHLTRANLADGIELTIRRHALDEACWNLGEETPAYFRVRAYLPENAQSPFVKTIMPTDHFFQTGYEVVDYLDFRLNEARSLPTQVEELMRAGPGAKVPHSLVAFLTAVPVQSDVTTNSTEAHKIRLLERDLWRNYVPGGIPEGMMVYHWKTTAPPIEDFSAVVKMVTRVSHRKALIKYLLLAFCFGVAGNLTAAWMWDCIKTKLAQERASPAADQTARPPNAENLTAPARTQSSTQAPNPSDSESKSTVKPDTRQK
jgi:hypothetical protein